MPYLSLIKMSRNSLQDQTNIPLIVTTNDGGTARSSTGTSLDSCSFKAKSCRSFYSRSSNQQQKLNSESHRNRSVPHNLQVWQLRFLLLHICIFTHTVYESWYTSALEQLTFICIIYIDGMAIHSQNTLWGHGKNDKF
jgi:hypothetical protein